MDYNYIVQDEGFHQWKKYAPLDVQYIKFAKEQPFLVAAGHKIEDVYHAFCNARASFMFVNSEDFGDLCGDNDISRLYTKTRFLITALIEYAICLDLSWQAVWAYIQPSSLEYLMEQKYSEMEKECSRDSVMAQLKCAISQHGYNLTKAQALLNEVQRFDKLENTLKLRSVYNGIKHQGNVHFEGLGENFTESSFAFNGKTFPMLHRKSYTVEEMEAVLFEYHKEFQIYFNNLIHIMIPEGYLEGKISLKNAIENLSEIVSVIN